MDDPNEGALPAHVDEPEPVLADLVRNLVDDAFARRRLNTMSRHARLEFMRREAEKARP